MALDLSRVRTALDSMNKSTSSSKKFWTPQIGTYSIRIVPYTHDKNWPFIDVYIYYKPFARASIISPMTINAPDPVVEIAEELKNSGSKEDWISGTKLMPKIRTYIPVLVRGEEEKGVQFWGINKFINEELLKLMDDPDYGDITSLSDGTDLTVDITKSDKTFNGKHFNEISIRPKRTTSKVTTDKTVLAMLDDQPTIEELWTIPTYDEMKKHWENYINNLETDVEPEEEGSNTKTTRSSKNEKSSDNFLDDLQEDIPTPNQKQVEKMTGKTSTKVDTPKVTAVDDLDAAFDDMFK